MKALALLSGGLDSTLAVKLMLDQSIEVEALNLVTPFCLCGSGGCGALETAKRLNVPLKSLSAGNEYLKIVRKPKHGYGRNMNPCIDCRILLFRKAKEYAKQIGTSIIFTGEVLGERPMSQHRKALELIEKEAGLEGQILRPLSAKLLPETEAEKKGWVNREKLLDISGRSRKKQIQLAEKSNITDYPCPSGGCLLTYREYANKLRDLFEHKKSVSLKDVQLLRVGRHFRYEKNKIIVGRNQSENTLLLHLKDDNDYSFEADIQGSPITILQGRKTRDAIHKAASLTAYYSDQKNGEIVIKFGKRNLHRTHAVTIQREKLDTASRRSHQKEAMHINMSLEEILNVASKKPIELDTDIPAAYP